MSLDSAAVLDMIGALKLILEFKRGLDRNAFLNDPKT